MSLLKNLATQALSGLANDNKNAQKTRSADASAADFLAGLLGQGKAGSGDLGGLLTGVLSAGAENKKGSKNALLLALLPVVLEFIQKNGGISGFLTKLQQSGLGAKAQSWIGGETEALSAKEVERALGEDEIDKACQSANASKDEVCQGIGEILPQVVSRLASGNSSSGADQHIGAALRQLTAFLGDKS